MGIVSETSRKPSFYSDVKKYGKHGERVFLEKEADKLTKKGYTVFDVTEDPLYQKIDIDFVVDKEGDDKLPDSPLKVIDNNRYVTVEVKLDTRALVTGNLPYEVVSHENLGWCCVSKCMFAYFVLTDEEGKEVKETLWVDKLQWDLYCADKTTKKKFNYIVNEKVVDLLCKIEDLKNFGAIK